MSEVIPAEAVEAAHKAWREQAALDGSIFEYNLRAALEAAAPYIRADALEDAADELVMSADNPHGKWLRARAANERAVK